MLSRNTGMYWYARSGSSLIAFMRSESIVNNKYPCVPIDGSAPALSSCQPGVRQDYSLYPNGTLRKQLTTSTAFYTTLSRQWYIDGIAVKKLTKAQNIEKLNKLGPLNPYSYYAYTAPYRFGSGNLGLSVMMPLYTAAASPSMSVKGNVTHDYPRLCEV